MFLSLAFYFDEFTFSNATFSAYDNAVYTRLLPGVVSHYLGSKMLHRPTTFGQIRENMSKCNVLMGIFSRMAPLLVPTSVQKIASGESLRIVEVSQIV